MKLFPYKPILGMVHVWPGAIEVQVAQALEDLNRLEDGGVDGVIIENYDWGYKDGNWADHSVELSTMAICHALATRATVPVGLNILPNDYRMAIRIAESCGGKFVQVDHVTGQFVGKQSVDPSDLLGVRAECPNIVVLGGIHPKYYTLVNPNTSIAESAQTAMRLTNAVVITGTGNAKEPNLDEAYAVRGAVGNHPIFVGSGVKPENVERLFEVADGAIVGSTFKARGVEPGEQIDVERVSTLCEVVARLRAARNRSQYL